ncbi:KOW motif containing protein [Metarhizium album ARSEF 1941]|uniref:KOW motif containing protein n=1 Tax=Metarhizium album (strain ARSEF 1941) TaxID=1081103 RepID=A0A0B2WVY8_METAS|nr:KOW motif containing protein [Metarhizium album ARSEF 1941]KHN97749.1 KOW motif containing protein [Metarhizium album ARSEF 1941]
MQKLAKRAAQAQRQATRRARQQMEREKIDHRMRNRQALRSAVSEVWQNLKDARQARKEDWEMGPLAPKRDLGFNNYGAFRETARQDWTNHGLHQARPQLIEKRCAWAGGAGQLNLAPQDRVVIMDGPDKGKIDRIRDVHPENGTVTLENHHRALSVGLFDGPARSQAMPISVGSIRLVYPLRNPEIGVTRDVIINQLKAVPPNMQSPNMSLDRWQYGRKWDRLVPGLNVVIPWPEVQAPVFETMKCDTVREQVEQRTFYYGLLSPPMPDQVLDELRNKYSRFRTRHEPWYIKQKEMEEAAKKGRLEATRSMQTPLAEFHERRREVRDTLGEPELSEDMLEKIGEYMAKKRDAALSQGGVSEVSSRAPAS